MNKKIGVVLLGAVLLALGFWLCWQIRMQRAPKAASEPIAASQGNVPVPPLRSGAQSGLAKSDAPQSAKMQQYEQRARDAGKSLNRPANFYGKILDQDNKPVVGATVKCGLSYFGDVVRPGLVPHYNQFDRTTDAQGRFAVEGEMGLVLDLRIDLKEGYTFKPEGLQVMLRDEDIDKPARTLSTVEKPYIFRALRRIDSNALSKGALAFYEFIPDGRSYVINLRRNLVAPGSVGGDFRLSVERPLGWTTQSDYIWALQIDALDFEILETPDEFLYSAPATNYTSRWSFAQKPGEAGYSRQIKRRFYLKSRDGSIFGGMEMQFISDYREGSGVVIKYVLNLKGGRILE